MREAPAPKPGRSGGQSNVGKAPAPRACWAHSRCGTSETKGRGSGGGGGIGLSTSTVDEVEEEEEESEEEEEEESDESSDEAREMMFASEELGDFVNDEEEEDLSDFHSDEEGRAGRRSWRLGFGVRRREA